MMVTLDEYLDKFGRVDTLPPYVVLTDSEISSMPEKMAEAIKRGQPLGPKDFGREEWYPNIDKGWIY